MEFDERPAGYAGQEAQRTNDLTGLVPGNSTVIRGYASLGYPNVHFGHSETNIVPMTTYASELPYPNNILLLEITTGAITNLGRTHLETQGKTSEGAMCVDRAGLFSMDPECKSCKYSNDIERDTNGWCETIQSIVSDSKTASWCAPTWWTPAGEPSAGTA